MKKKAFSKRITVLSFVFVFSFFVLISQLYIVQIVKGEAYREKADDQYVKPQYVFNRGNIYFQDKDGETHLAGTNLSGFQIVINPTLIEDPALVYEKLNELIEIDKDDFFERANRQDDTYEVIKRKIDDDLLASKIKALDLKGVTLELDKWRFYPAGTLAAHALGFVGYSGDSLVGRYGIENYYDYLLQRKSKNLFVNFFADVFSNLGSVLDSKDEKEKEGDVILTIEPDVQAFLENALAKLNDKQQADLSGGIIINPHNGEIYGLGIAPAFDPNNFSQAEEGVRFGNPLVENVYEMGSIIKSLTMAIGLDTGAIDAETTYNDTGSRMIDGRTISNYDGRARGVVPMQEVLNQSLNMGAVFIQQKVGNEKFLEYFLNLGLGEETGIDLPTETYGLVDNLKTNRDIEYATASYGHGIALTPIGTVKALSALANGGLSITPHLAKKINYGLISSSDVFYPVDKRVFKEETSKEISRMLSLVVEKALLGGEFESDNYHIAAKTGTAQMNKKTGGYYEENYFHSFFGYFPATKPEFLVFLYVIDPKKEQYASHTLTEPFMDILNFLVNYYEVTPDKGKLVESL